MCDYINYSCLEEIESIGWKNVFKKLYKFLLEIWKRNKRNKVKRKIEAGSNAIRRLNAIDEALVTRTPFRKPLITNVITWLIGTPSKPAEPVS
jgi:hypothetical protein